MKKSIGIILLVLFIDQALKFYIKLNFTLGEMMPVFNHWFDLYFTENNGMAYGFQLGGSWGKLFLSIFRILAVIGIGYLLVSLWKNKKSTGLILALSLIFAGALGNIIDSVFYGLIFTQSTFYSVAHLVSPGQGYASFLHGQVVDMLYFPLIDIARSDAPSWLPSFLFGPDNHFIFFRPIFNISDSAITIGVLWLLIFERKHIKF